MKIIGRIQEIDILEKISNNSAPQFVAIYGRRRIGKTFLVRSIFEKEPNYLEVTGIKGGNLETQLSNFARAFSEKFLNNAEISFKSWDAAFNALYRQIVKCNSKFIIFLDELPWLASKRSHLLGTLEHYWNTKFSKLQNIKVVLCGSSASWMLSKIVHAKGGLHNRLTRILSLDSFSLKETRDFLQSRKIRLPNDQILDIYLVTGGVPFYLETVDPGASSTQVIQANCFSKNGILYKEFESLFSSLFDEDRGHERIVMALGKRRYGLSKQELLKFAHLKDTGSASRALRELEASSFIRKYEPFGGSSRNSFYRLIDEYTLFYLSWILPLKKTGLDIGKDHWIQQSQSNGYKVWGGYSFELTCLKHVEKIKIALGVSGLNIIPYTWRSPASSSPSAQIDLVLDRADRSVNLCEIKYSKTGISINSKLRNELMRKQGIFIEQTKTKKAVTSVVISSGGFFNGFDPDSAITAAISGEALFAG